MAKHDRRVYAPPPEERGRGRAPGARARAEARGAEDAAWRHEEHPARRLQVFGLLVALVAGFGVLIWNAYDGGGNSIPRISPEASTFKRPGPAVEASAPAAVAAPPDVAAATPETPTAEAQETAPPQEVPAGPPQFVREGPFVAQIAALQSQDAIDPLWRRLSARAPDLFAAAQLDVQRADLGPRGVYYRVRVGYFADQENAGRFCERMRAMGQDCVMANR